MAKASSFFFFVFLLSFNILLLQTSCHRNAPGRHPAFFLFGDSFLDAGNNNYINTTTLDQANFWPYGETFFKYPTGRFSNGRLIPDFVAKYANLPFIPPFLQPGVDYNKGVNFASAGAGALVETFQGSVINLKTQIRYFKKVNALLKRRLGKVEAEKMMSRAVYLVSIGINDYLSLFVTNSTALQLYTKAQFVEMVIGNVTIAITEIYKKGGRKFGFINVPYIGCFPGLRRVGKDGSCLEEASLLAEYHNSALSKLLNMLGNKLRGFKYSLYDMNKNTKDLIFHHSKYGFKEGDSACCGTGEFRGIFSCGGKRPVKEFELCENPSEHVFWDSYHFTETVYKHVAAQMWHGNVDSYVQGPHNMKNLFQL